jgi:hypothetical protein
MVRMVATHATRVHALPSRVFHYYDNYYKAMLFLSYPSTAPM